MASIAFYGHSDDSFYCEDLGTWVETSVPVPHYDVVHFVDCWNAPETTMRVQLGKKGLLVVAQFIGSTHKRAESRKEATWQIGVAFCKDLEFPSDWNFEILPNSNIYSLHPTPSYSPRLVIHIPGDELPVVSS